jgi:hypothetical protein
VRVEVRAGDPRTSRIAGMRRAPFGPVVALTALLPAAGLVVLAFGLRGGRRALRLLRIGKVGHGTLVGEEPTGVRVNRRRVMKLRFALATEEGTRPEVVVRTHLTERVKDDARERILYDPARPEDAFAWDLLPGPPRVGPGGALEPPGLPGSLAVLAAPALALAAEAAALVLLR